MFIHRFLNQITWKDTREEFFLIFLLISLLCAMVEKAPCITNLTTAKKTLLLAKLTFSNHGYQAILLYVEVNIVIKALDTRRATNVVQHLAAKSHLRNMAFYFQSKSKKVGQAATQGPFKTTQTSFSLLAVPSLDRVHRA